MSKAEVIWWEKTVEYKFLLDFTRNISNADAYPLASVEEEAGDAMFSVDGAQWALFEFKRDENSFKSELKKFAVAHNLFKVLEEVLKVSLQASEEERNEAQAKLENCKVQISNDNLGLSDLNEKTAIEADASTHCFGTRLQAAPATIVSSVEPTVPTASSLHSAAKALIQKLQNKAFEAAKTHLFAPGSDSSCHWIVYGKFDAETKCMKLCNIQYFQLFDKRDAGALTEGNAPSSFVGWNSTQLKEYVDQFINFKLYGVPLNEDDKNGGGRSWPQGVLPANPSYIIGVNDKKVLVAPLDNSTETCNLLQRLSPPKAPPTARRRPSA
ncbi:hypothetical protein [Janthinobacterium sp. SUN206]|uniref:hypothetical protein n=1 Tax=Janthinobacterium sp. SUN206 TaxID=3014787 RepID=UPI002712D0A7|nr:hypothetical protein [Janthinobacterium sp. SUN206]MDO8065625.1 hypothetical protein [Janthinobacterium sp. SUN206]